MSDDKKNKHGRHFDIAAESLMVHVVLGVKGIINYQSNFNLRYENLIDQH